MTGILVRVGMRGNFEAALSRVTVARSKFGTPLRRAKFHVDRAILGTSDPKHYSFTKYSYLFPFQMCTYIILFGQLFT